MAQFRGLKSDLIKKEGCLVGDSEGWSEWVAWRRERDETAVISPYGLMSLELGVKGKLFTKKAMDFLQSKEIEIKGAKVTDKLWLFGGVVGSH